MSSESYRNNLNYYSHHQQQQPQQQQPVHYQQPSSSNPNAYLTLLALADSFQKAHQYRLAIHCLESILTLKNQDLAANTNYLHVQLKTRLNLCRLYLKHTLSTNQQVNAFLEKSIILVQNLNQNDEYRYEATYLIYKIFQKQKLVQNQLKLNCTPTQQIDPVQTASLFSIELMQKILETSSSFPVWHIRLIFLIADILMHEKEYGTAAQYMSIGIGYCTQNRLSSYTHIMFILCKGLIHLLQRNPTDLQTTMQPCASLIENFTDASPNQIESLKIFFLVLQVTYFLQCGQMKSVKNTLKSLQHYSQLFFNREETTIITPGRLDNFQWLNKDHLNSLVYLLTTIHSMQTGSFEKVQKLAEKALMNIQKIKMTEQAVSVATNKNSSISYNTEYITNVLQFMFFEHMIRCSIVTGNRRLAIEQIGSLFQLCDQDSRLMNAYSAQLHCLVGLYSLSMDLKDQALAQFNQSLKHTSDTELWLYNAMNSAVCYMLLMKTNPNIKSQLIAIVDNLLPDKIQTQSTSLTAFSYYFRALTLFLNSNFKQAKESLKEAVLFSNSEELLNITTNSYIFMGHIDLLSAQYQESFDKLKDGKDMAEKMQDIQLKSYSNSLLRDIFKICGDVREAEAIAKCNELDQKITSDYYEAIKMPQHILIEWDTNFSPKKLLESIQTNQKTAVPTPQELKQSPYQSNSQQTPQQQPKQAYHQPSPSQIQYTINTNQQQQQQQHYQQTVPHNPIKNINQSQVIHSQTVSSPQKQQFNQHQQSYMMQQHNVPQQVVIINPIVNQQHIQTYQQYNHVSNQISYQQPQQYIQQNQMNHMQLNTQQQYQMQQQILLQQQQQQLILNQTQGQQYNIR